MENNNLQVNKKIVVKIDIRTLSIILEGGEYQIHSVLLVHLLRKSMPLGLTAITAWKACIDCRVLNTTLLYIGVEYGETFILQNKVRC